MYVGIYVGTVGMVGMLSLDALLLVCHGFDRWGSW